MKLLVMQFSVSRHFISLRTSSNNNNNNNNNSNIGGQCLTYAGDRKHESVFEASRQQGLTLWLERSQYQYWHCSQNIQFGLIICVFV
jgi:hypothetical protein